MTHTQAFFLIPKWLGVNRVYWHTVMHHTGYNLDKFCDFVLMKVCYSKDVGKIILQKMKYAGMFDVSFKLFPFSGTCNNTHQNVDKSSS